MPTVTVIDGVTFTCTNAFETIPAALRPGQPSLRAALGRELTDDEKDDPSVEFVADELSEQEGAVLRAAFDPAADPVPHPSWNLTEEQMYCLFMDHFHWYGRKNWREAFESIYGRDRNAIRRKDYDERADRWAIRQRDRGRDDFYSRGLRPFDIGYTPAFKDRSLNDAAGAKIRAEIEEQVKRGELIEKIVEDAAKAVADKIGAGSAAGPKKLELPMTIPASALVANDSVRRAPDIWSGVVRIGDKLFFGGPSKAHKSFAMTGLSIAVVNGMAFWNMATLKSKVLYCDFEQQPGTCKERIRDIAEAMKAPSLAGLEVWNLRGYAASIDILKPEIIKMAKKDYGMIVLDPAYMCLGRRDENSAGDVADFCNCLGEIERATGATVCVGLHYAKGNASGKSAQDRTSGSGVFARYPDTILNITPHAEDDACVVSAIQRDHKQLDEFCIRWSYPISVRDDKLDPTDLKLPSLPGKGNPTVEHVLEAIGRRELNKKGLKSIMMDDLGFSDNKSRDAIEKAIQQGAIVPTEGQGAKKAGNPGIFFRTAKAD